MTDDAKPAEFKLDKNDTAQPLWAKLRTHYEAKLAQLRAQNDDPGKDPIKTAALRGRIAEVKALLALASPAPATEADADDGE